MNFIESIKTRAKENKKTIVLPETMDKRVLQAGIKATQEGIANIIFKAISIFCNALPLWDI